MRSYSVHPYAPNGSGTAVYDPAWENEGEADEAFDLYEDVWWDEEDYALVEEWYPPQPPGMLVVILVGFVIVVAMMGGLVHLSSQVQVEQVASSVPSGNVGTGSKLYVEEPTAVTAPYTNYALTQGLHGQSYGHLAIDLAAGRGEPVRSPINGFVTNLYVDEYGNTTLLIENDVYAVTMLHGDFSVAIGDQLRTGQIVGTEGNNGYTMDFLGNLCYGRVYCGNHTHLNIFDKRMQANVNPLDLMQ